MKIVTAMWGETEHQRFKNHEVCWSNLPGTTKTCLLLSEIWCTVRHVSVNWPIFR